MARKNFDEFLIMINLSGPRYWKVSKNQIQVADAPLTNEIPVISFGEFDFRGFFGDGASRSIAKKYFLREFSEKCRLLYSGSKKPIYATPVHRLAEFDHPLFPGSWFLDRLLERDKVDYKEKDRIVGFSLEAGSVEDGSSSRFLILFAWRTDGSMSQPEITINPHDIELVVTEFAKSNDVNVDEILLYPTEDVLDIGPGNMYPPEEDVSGIAYSKIYQSLAGIFAIGFLGFTGINALTYQKIESEKAIALEVKKQIEKVKSDQGKVVGDHIYSFANATSIRPSNIFSAVENLYSPQVDIGVASSVLKSGTDGRVGLRFLTHEKLTGEDVPQEIVHYLTLKKEYLNSNKILLTYNGSGKYYEAEYTFKAVDDSFFNIIGN